METFSRVEKVLELQKRVAQNTCPLGLQALQNAIASLDKVEKALLQDLFSAN